MCCFQRWDFSVQAVPLPTDHEECPEILCGAAAASHAIAEFRFVETAIFVKLSDAAEYLLFVAGEKVV